MDLGSELVQGAWTFPGYIPGRDVRADMYVGMSIPEILDESYRQRATSTDPWSIAGLIFNLANPGWTWDQSTPQGPALAGPAGMGGALCIDPEAASRKPQAASRKLQAASLTAGQGYCRMDL